MRYIPGIPGEGSTVADGEHPFEVNNAEEKQSKTSGNDMLEVALKIKDGPIVYDYLLGIDESRWKLDNFLASIGYDFKPGIPIDINPEKLIGLRGTCLLYTDTYEGRKKNKVADYVVIIAGPGAKSPTPAPLAQAKNSWR
jgi:hypothetical protein